MSNPDHARTPPATPLESLEEILGQAPWEAFKTSGASTGADVSSILPDAAEFDDVDQLTRAIGHDPAAGLRGAWRKLRKSLLEIVDSRRKAEHRLRLSASITQVDAAMQTLVWAHDTLELVKAGKDALPANDPGRKIDLAELPDPPSAPNLRSPVKRCLAECYRLAHVELPEIHRSLTALGLEQDPALSRQVDAVATKLSDALEIWKV